MTLVVAQEKQAGGFEETDTEMAVYMDGFTALADIEAKRRVGVRR